MQKENTEEKRTNEEKIRGLLLADSVMIDGKVWTRAPGCLIIAISQLKPVFSGTGSGPEFFNMQQGGTVRVEGGMDASVNLFSNMVKVPVPDSFFRSSSGEYERP